VKNRYGLIIWIEPKPNKNGENHYKHNSYNGIGQFILVWGKPQKSEKPRNKPNTGKIWKTKAEARSVSE